jgi:hypothetical protein
LTFSARLFIVGQSLQNAFGVLLGHLLFLRLLLLQLVLLLLLLWS